MFVSLKLICATGTGTPCVPPADSLRWAARGCADPSGRGRSGSSAVRAGDRRVVRRPPQRVDEDPGRAPCRADALDLAAGDPVVDGPAAHVEEFARLVDRDGCPRGRHRFDRHTLHWNIATSHGRPARTGPLNTLNKAYRHRVTEATATAQGRPSHEFASRYTRG